MRRLFKKNKKVFIVLFVIAVGVFACFSFVFAQATEEVTGGLEAVGEGAGIATTTDIRVVIARIIQVLFGFLGIIALSLVVYGGFVWMTAGGDAEKVGKAKKILVNAFIGLAIVLLAFSITTYIITQLQQALEPEPTEYEFEEDDGIGDGGPVPGAYRVNRVQLVGDIPIRNVVIRATFNEKLGSMTEEELRNNFNVSTETVEEVSGMIVADNYTIAFTPDAPCPEPNEDLYCFDEDTTYRVQIRTDIVNEDGDNLTCGIGSVCTIQFTTGNLVDTKAPVIYITRPLNNEYICEEFFTLKAYTKDDSAISTVKFYVDDQFIGADAPLDLASTYLAELDIEVPLDQVGAHTVGATVFDIDNNQTTSSSKNFIVPIAHCCNEIQDADETGLNCGGADCPGCTGDWCEEDADCASGICQDNVCVDWPTITGLSHTEGAAGNLLTIWGIGFASYLEGTSKVEFTSPTGLIEAGVACDPSSSWNNYQVIVKVPAGASTGLIKLTNANGDYDDTENNRGWPGVFTINPDLSWPGLCSVANEQTGLPEGQYEDLLTAAGEKFGASGDLMFGAFLGQVFGTWSDTQITGIKVPNIDIGRILISVISGGAVSNPVEFNVLSSEKIPEIVELDPNKGGASQYVKLKGNNFGSSPMPVFFINQANDEETQADITFPEACTGSLWSDNEALVKVPNINLGLYYVQIKSAEVESNQIEFEVTDDLPTPGICGMDPDNGPVGTPVIIYGEGFDDGRFEFSDHVGTEITNIITTSFDTLVPPLSISGPVQYFNPDDIGSNTLNFTVGACTPDSCAEKSTDLETYECCANGVCQLEGTCEEVVTAGECEFAWMFSTGKLPLVPKVMTKIQMQNVFYRHLTK